MADSAINLPADAYLHVGAPREWWWHIGTLNAGARTFGFEINAAGFSAAEGSFPASNFSQIMLSDVQNQTHYRKTTNYTYDPGWAQADQTKPWFAGMGDRASSDYVAMTSPSPAEVGSLHVQASFTDDTTGTVVSFDLQMTQAGPPLLVWGTGVAENVVPSGTTPLTRNNYYYSYTNLQVTGVVKIGAETIQVTGVTWMDHEYGAFPVGTRWVLQDAQLTNGVSITNSGVGKFTLAAGMPILTYTTILKNGVSTLAFPTFSVPSKPWTSDGTTYYLHWDVYLLFQGALHFEAVMADQLFPGQRAVYEGAASVTGTFGGEAVEGTGWIEEAVAPVNSTSQAARGQRGLPSVDLGALLKQLVDQAP